MGFTFTVSREDFKNYFRCPKKLALKIMGFKAREFKRKQRLVYPAHEIGLSGEKLTEQILEIIASIQAEKSGEKVEVLTKREEKERQIMQEVSEQGFSLDFEKPEVGQLGEKLVRSTVGKAFETRISIESFLEQYKRKIIQETSQKFTALMGDLYNKLPKIKLVYKPVLKNRDICSLGYPDFQIDSEQGQILIEVKNWANMNTGLKEGKLDLLYYNSLLADKILGASTHLSEKLPIPIKSLLVMPRFGLVKEIDDPIPNYREIAVEIWTIKKQQ